MDNQVQLGVRVPANLKAQLMKFCINSGVKMNFLVAQAIKDKLLEIAEDQHDTAVAKARMKDAQFVSQKDFDKQMAKLGIKS
ncbi:MAG: hypothetical protein ACI9CF_001315 [Candidatus Omnitrophota bacterium]|jgi:hypothetical protein